MTSIKIKPTTAVRLYWLTAVVYLGVNGVFLIDYFQRPHRLFDFVKHAYAFNTLWAPPLLLVVGMIGLIALRGTEGRKWPRRMGILWIVAGMGLIAARAWATHIEPNMLFVRRVEIESAKIDRPLRILHMTDLQAASIGRHERRAFETARELKPDMIIFTGDMLQPLPPATMESELPKTAALWETLDPPLGKYAVIGDVDNAETLKPWLGGLTLLDGAETTIAFGEKKLRLRGLWLHFSRKADKDVRREIEDWLAAGEPEDFTILFGHGPDFAVVAQDYPIDLCLAGHTHGGQIRVPWLGPLVTLSQVPREWALGYREAGKTRLNVSGGIGAEHIVGLPSIRVNCPPEMTMIDLE